VENVFIFYDPLEYFMEIWDVLWPFGTFCFNLVHFSGFGIVYQEKSGNPGLVVSSPPAEQWVVRSNPTGI
jgi:hypothetical protein